jgi:hypothetical protein
MISPAAPTGVGAAGVQNIFNSVPVPLIKIFRKRLNNKELTGQGTVLKKMRRIRHSNSEKKYIGMV